VKLILFETNVAIVLAAPGAKGMNDVKYITLGSAPVKLSHQDSKVVGSGANFGPLQVLLTLGAFPVNRDSCSSHYWGKVVRENHSG